MPTQGKRPLGYQWEQYPLTPQSILEQLARAGKVFIRDRSNSLYQAQPTGIGLLCGQNSNKIYILQPENLENSWQTQLGLFILAETQEVPAENISIIYCFINGDDYPTTYQFNYSQEKNEAFIERLAMTLSKLPMTRNSHNSNLSVEDEMNEHLLNLQKLFRGEINTAEYLTTIPEVEI